METVGVFSGGHTSRCSGLTLLCLGLRVTSTALEQALGLSWVLLFLVLFLAWVQVHTWVCTANSPEGLEYSQDLRYSGREGWPESPPQTPVCGGFM